MSSEIKADKWSPASGTSATIGDSGDTYTIPSGVTFTNNGTATGFAPAGISSASTSGTALQITSGNIVGAGSDATNADLGVGIHIKTADSGASVNSDADQLVIETGSGSGGMSILSATNGTGDIYFGDSGNNASGYIQYNHTDNFMRFGLNGASEKMRIDSSGKVLINTPSTITGEGELQVSGNTSQNLSAWRVATNGQYGLRFFNSSTQSVGFIRIDGASTTYSTSSDYRLKENEVAISDGIERLKQLKPYKFNFKTEPDTTVDGFFAHEVSSIVPEAISGEKDATETYMDDNGDEQTRINPQGIDQSKLVPLLTSALQEAITKIETLEAENTDIKARLTALENA
jgi:hypothetical protein